MKIGLCGTMSTGKTTIVKALKKELKGHDFFVERSVKLMDKGIPLNQESTFKGQIAFFAERALELTHENFVTDRTVIDVLSFSEAAKDITKYQQWILKNLYNSLVDDYDLIIYIPMTLPMEDNGVRETNEAYRKLIDETIRKNFDSVESGQAVRTHILQSTKDVDSKVKEILELIK